MTEPAPDAPAQEPEPQKSDQPADEPPKADDTDWKAEARKWEERAKENGKAKAELEKQRKASMTEAEKAVAEAEQKGRTAAAQEYGKRLVTSEVRSAAVDAGADLAGVFDYLDLGRFIGEDGEPDEKAIKAFVGGLPKKDTPPPSFDGGTRTPAQAPQSMSQIIRKAAGRA